MLVTLAELVRDIAYHNPEWRPSDIEQRARLLREAGLLPRGVRGRAGPVVGSRDVATLIVGLAATGKAVEVEAATRDYMALVPSDQHALAGAPDFGSALTMALEDSQVMELVDRVSICRSWPEAWIVFRVGKKAKKIRESYVPLSGKPTRRDQIEIAATIRRDMLITLGTALVD